MRPKVVAVKAEDGNPYGGFKPETLRKRASSICFAREEERNKDTGETGEDSDEEERVTITVLVKRGCEDTSEKGKHGERGPDEREPFIVGLGGIGGKPGRRWNLRLLS